MKVDNALGLFDMTVTPVAMYGVEYWGMLSLPAASFQSKESLLKAWENVTPETVNQKVLRVLLSRLAMRSELGRNPYLIKQVQVEYIQQKLKG